MGVLDLALAGGLVLVTLLSISVMLRLRAAERRHRSLFRHLPQTLVTVFDHDLRVRFAGGSSPDFAGRTPDQIEGTFLLGHIPKAQRESLLIHYRAALRGEQRSFEFRSELSGRLYWTRVVPMTDANGKVTGGLSVAIDISDRSQTEHDLRSHEDGVDAVTDATRALARSVDPAAARVAVCEGAREVAGAPVAALFEPSAERSALIPEASVGADLAGLELSLAGEGGSTLAFMRAEEVFVSVGDPGGESDREFMRRARARAVLWHPVVRDRAAIGVLAIAWREPVAGVSPRLSTMIDLLAAEAAVAIGRADLLGQLEYLARTDGLTGLPNRRHWEQHLPRELSRAVRDRTDVCVAMLDLDHFKSYNDRHGHQAGDAFLVRASSAWAGALRPYDILARYGGEEFAVILPGCDLANAVTLVERLRGFTPEGESCSAGIAVWDGDEQPEALVGRVDAALYRAKRSGRNRSIVASSI